MKYLELEDDELGIVQSTLTLNSIRVGVAERTDKDSFVILRVTMKAPGKDMVSRGIRISLDDDKIEDLITLLRYAQKVRDEQNGNSSSEE